MAKGLKGRSSVDLGREDDDMTDVARGNNNMSYNTMKFLIKIYTMKCKRALTMIVVVSEDHQNFEAHRVIIDGQGLHADWELIPFPLPLHQTLPGLHHYGGQKHPNLH